jgi:hypothetical protein
VRDGLLTLTGVTFVAGSAPGEPSTSVAPGHVTVLVGPNNSGKSLALQEIAWWANGSGGRRAQPWQPGSVIQSIEARWPSDSSELCLLLNRRPRAVRGLRAAARPVPARCETAPVPETTIVRLTYEAGVGTARMLSGSDVASLRATRCFARRARSAPSLHTQLWSLKGIPTGPFMRRLIGG